MHTLPSHVRMAMRFEGLCVKSADGISSGTAIPEPLGKCENIVELAIRGDGGAVGWRSAVSLSSCREEG